MDYLTRDEEEEISTLKNYVAAVEALGKKVRLIKYGIADRKELRTPIPSISAAATFLQVADVSCYGDEVGIEVRLGEPDEHELEALRRFDACKPGSHVHPREPRIVGGSSVDEYLKSREDPPASDA